VRVLSYNNAIAIATLITPLIFIGVEWQIYQQKPALVVELKMGV
jgi:hypothetical protein